MSIRQTVGWNVLTFITSQSFRQWQLTPIFQHILNAQVSK